MKLVLIATLILITSTPVMADKKGTEPVATVNGASILLQDFEQEYQQNLLLVTDKKVTKQKVLDDLVNRRLGIAKARKGKLEDDPTVKRKMEDVLYHAQVSKDLEPELQKISVTDKEVESYYTTHKEYRTAQILVRMRAVPEKAEAEEALNHALRIYQTLKKEPGKFAELANKFSQSSTAPSGGDLGFQPAVRLAPEYFSAIQDKPTDYISPPVRTQFGYHIIKVMAVKEFKDIDTSLYKKVVYDQKRDQILASYFENLRKGATIKIEKKYLE